MNSTLNVSLSAFLCSVVGSKSNGISYVSLVTKTYRGDMTKVGESVAVTGVMSTSDTIDESEREVGYFNMIDATDERMQ